MKFRIIGGDGDQRLITGIGSLRLVSDHWKEGANEGTMWLLQAEGGSFPNAYFAIESRVQSSLKSQADSRVSLSAILYVVAGDFDMNKSSEANCESVGMVVLALIR